MQILSHDPFARQSSVKARDHAARECAWCGCTDRPLARYGTERDDRPGRPGYARQAFCSKSCFRAFHS